MKIGNINSYARLLHDSFSEIDNLLYDEDYNEIPDRFNRDSFKNLRNQFRREVIYNLRKTDLWTVKEALIIKFNDFINEFENKYQTTVYDCNYHKNEELILSLYSCLKEEIQYVKWLFNDYVVDFGFCTGSGLDKLNDEAQSLYVEEEFDMKQVGDNTNILANSHYIEKNHEEENINKQFVDLFKPEYKQFVDNFVQILEFEGVIENNIFTGIPDKNYLAKIVAFLMEDNIMCRSKIEPLIRTVYSRFGWCVYGDKEMKPEKDRCVTVKNLTKTVKAGVNPDEEDLFRKMLKQIKK